jgi:uncharacterized protein (UPF0332 family)
MEVETLLIKANRALASAQLLYANGDYEGACNRAYYAMFDAARSSLLYKLPNNDLTSARTHNGLIAAFGLHIVKTGLVDVTLGRNLNRAQTLRQLADYTGEPIPADDVHALIKTADSFLQQIVKLVEVAE